jgi:DNA-directed RNA polymerase specialized sigma24 family protein
VSLTPAQRAQVLYLYQVEGMSVIFIAAMMGLSRTAVQQVLSSSSQPAQEKAAAMRPSSKGRVERQLHLIHADLRRRGTS